MAKINVQLKALPGQKVNALNYRCRPAQWETGTVRRVESSFDKTGNYRNSYRVLLNRTTTGKSRMFPDGGSPIFLQVSDDNIELIK
jgi:hypothetical protein